MSKVITKDLWVEWQNHPVTSELYASLREKIEDGRDELSSLDIDPKRDAIVRGMIWAFNNVIDAKPDFSVEELTSEVSS